MVLTVVLAAAAVRAAAGAIAWVPRRHRQLFTALVVVAALERPRR